VGAVLSISGQEYDSTVLAHPEARLKYLDDDDGEVITVSTLRPPTGPVPLAHVSRRLARNPSLPKDSMSPFHRLRDRLVRGSAWQKPAFPTTPPPCPAP
jgi:hypothetical protein